MVDSELSYFKKNIDLRAYAAGQGYQIHSRESWQGSAVMRHPASHDKVIIKRGMDGHYIYFSVRDDRDNGSIIDFVQFRKGFSLGAVRKELRPWIGQPPAPVPVFLPLHRMNADRVKVETAFAQMQEIGVRHPYLERERALSPAVLASDRFVGRIRLDPCKVAIYPNAIFPHFDADGLCGYEIKNVDFTGFAKAGAKALWISHERPDDNRLVLCESAIDALSHAVLFPDDRARYASIGGKPNPQQPELIRMRAAAMAADSEIVAAMDNDADGARLVDVVRKAVAMTGRHDLRFSVQQPLGAKDWNDVLRLQSKPALPCRAENSSVG